MLSIIKILILSIFSYIFGSIPFGFIVSSGIKKADIRNFGSGNIGATNVVRVLGFKWGLLVFILDFLKGFIPVALVFVFFSQKTTVTNLASIIVALLAMAGHNWPLFLGFRGGKGVSTGIGTFMALAVNFSFIRIPILAALLGWLVIFLLFHIVGLASIVSFFLFFITSLLIGRVPLEFKLLSFVMFTFVVIRHKTNIRQLIEEHKVR